MIDLMVFNGMSLCQDDMKVATAFGANSGIYQLTMYMLPWAECQITTSCIIANDHTRKF